MHIFCTFDHIKYQCCWVQRQHIQQLLLRMWHIFWPTTEELIFQKHTGWHWDGQPGRAGKRGQQMGCPISSCPLCYGQLLHSRSLSGPLYSPGSVNLICNKRKRVFSVKITAFSVKTKPQLLVKKKKGEGDFRLFQISHSGSNNWLYPNCLLLPYFYPIFFTCLNDD